MSGYVYLIGTPVFGWYKIGKSITPEVRVKDLGILLNKIPPETRIYPAEGIETSFDKFSNVSFDTKK